MAKKEIKKVKIKRRSVIGCGYCQNFEKSGFCKLKREVIRRGEFHPRCKEFVPVVYFHCKRHDQRYNILACIDRRRCVKKKVGLFNSFKKCKKCGQYEIIKKLVNEGKSKPIVQMASKIKRRKKSTPIISKIKRREKHSTTKITRRRRHGK